MTLEPVAPASSHLPSRHVAEPCLQTTSQSRSGAGCSTEGAQEGRGAEAAHSGDQGSGCLPSGVLAIPQHSWPFGLVGDPGSNSREWSQHVTSQKAAVVASERGVEGEWEMSPQNWCSSTSMYH